MEEVFTLFKENQETQYKITSHRDFKTLHLSWIFHFSVGVMTKSGGIPPSNEFPYHTSHKRQPVAEFSTTIHITEQFARLGPVIKELAHQLPDQIFPPKTRHD